MCPSKQLLSAYIDKELPARFAKTIAEHLSFCSECLEAVKQYEAVSGILTSSDDTQDVTLSQLSVWREIQSHIMKRRRTPLFLRSIRVPMPVLIGMALLLTFGALTIRLSPRGGSTLNGNAAIAELPTFDDMDELLIFLETQQRNTTIKMNIPEEPVFFFKSKPTLIHKAEFR